MFGDNLKDQFSKDLLDAASKILKKETPKVEETLPAEEPATESKDMIGQFDEAATGRSYAEHGFIHPNEARFMVPFKNKEIDFYGSPHKFGGYVDRTAKHSDLVPTDISKTHVTFRHQRGENKGKTFQLKIGHPTAAQLGEDIENLNEAGIADLHKSMNVGETKDLGNGRYAHKFGMKLGKMRNGPVIVALHQLAHDTGCGLHREEVGSNLTTRAHHVTITGHRHKIDSFLNTLGGSVKEEVILEGRPFYTRYRPKYATNVKPFHETEAGKKALAAVAELGARQKKEQEARQADPDYFKKRLDAAKAHKEEVEGWGGITDYFIESGTRIYPMFDKARSKACDDFAKKMVNKHRDGNFSKYGQHAHFSSMAFWANAALDQHAGHTKQVKAVYHGMGAEHSAEAPSGITIHPDHVNAAIEHMKKARTEYTLGKMKKEEFQGDLDVSEEDIERCLMEMLEDLAEMVRPEVHPWYERTDKGHEFGYTENGKRIRTGLMGAHPAVDKVITRMISSHVETINNMNATRKWANERDARTKKEEVDLTEILGLFKGKNKGPNPNSMQGRMSGHEKIRYYNMGASHAKRGLPKSCPTTAHPDMQTQYHIGYEENS